MEIQGPEMWYTGLPRITRAYITSLLLITLLAFVKAFDPSLLSLDWTLVKYKLELWRILSNCFYIGPFSFRWFSSMLEKDQIFANSIGSYLYFVIIQIILLSIVSLVIYWPTGLPYLGDALLSAIIYYWSRRNSFAHVSIYFFTVKGYQLPFAMLFFHLIMGSTVWIDIIGILSGHTYYVIREVIPRKGFPNLFLRTPVLFDKTAKMLENLLSFTPQNNTSPYPYYHRPSNQETRNQGFIGRGIRLGGSQ